MLAMGTAIGGGASWGMRDMGHMRGFGHHQMWGYGLVDGLWPWLGVATGVAVVLGAAMLYVKPTQARGWGALVLIASGVNLMVGMGGILASTLGIVGGALGA
jgi:hypothetical protein